MRTGRLTPETAAELHLARARAYWREDRLELAHAAMLGALRVGIPAGDLYDLQRTIEAELAARRAGERLRLEEHLEIEADPQLWADLWPFVLTDTSAAAAATGRALSVRWAKPILVTLFARDDWADYMHARYGYYAERTERHKVCLPPSAAAAREERRRALRHEMAHAAAHALGGEGVPRWLDEGIAVTLEGGPRGDERRRYRIARRRGAVMSLAQVSAALEGYAMALNTAEAEFCYSSAADFVGRQAKERGMGALRDCLARIGAGQSPERAWGRAFGRSLRAAEAEWQRARGEG
ncbi:MAG: hypothetical protein IT208_13430 [Chthonomonadales bacterium]|nr:hypothetical protein [Chthonomonadales bacterium]